MDMKDMLPLMMAMNNGKGGSDMSALMPMLAAMNGGGGSGGTDMESMMNMMSMMNGGGAETNGNAAKSPDNNMAMLAMMMSMMNNNSGNKSDKTETTESDPKSTDFNFEYYNKLVNKNKQTAQVLSKKRK